MQEDIRISVCIPTYNKYETIEYTILSVINQSFQKWELLIIDDSNNSYTEDIVKKHSVTDSRIKYLKNKERFGLVKNWNECIKQANFEYVYILHHDDFLMPGVFQAYNDFANENPECGLIHSNCYYVTLPYFRKTIGKTQDRPILEKGDKAVEKVLFNNNLACSTVMIKKECYNKLGLFDESAWVSPDWEMWARIGEYYDFGHVDLIGCVVVLDNNNTHLSGIEVNEFYLQQRYYYKKILTYFSENFRRDNLDLEFNAELNLKKTIDSLTIQYSNMFDFKTAKIYSEKSGRNTDINLLIINIKSLLRYLFIVLFTKKKSFKQIFDLTYNKNMYK